MVKHIVCFKLKDNSLKNCEKTKAVLLSMEGKVPMIRKIAVNIDELKTGRSFDVILEVYVDSFDDLVAYQEDPYHVNVVKKYMAEARIDSIAMDYSVEDLNS